MKKSIIVLIGLAVCVIGAIFISCGEDAILSPSDKAVSTFESVIDFSTSQSFHAITEASDDNIIAGGSILFVVIDTVDGVVDTTNNYEAYIVKFDGNGDTLWTTIIGELSTDESVVEIIRESGGGYVALITINARAGFPTNDLRFHWISETGESVSQSVLHTERIPFIEDMIQTPDNGFVIVGSGGSLFGPPSMFAMKVDADGNKLWSNVSQTGAFNRIKLLSDDNILLSGYHLDRFDSLSTNRIYLMKVSALGDSLFAAEFILGENSYSSDVIVTSDNEFRILGQVYDVMGDSYCILNADSNGVALSAQFFYDSNLFFIRDGAFTSGGGAIICGYTYNPIATGYLARIDPSEGVSWTNLYNYSQSRIELTCLISTSDGGYVIAGSFTDDITGYTNALVIKTDGNGVSAGAE